MGPGVVILCMLRSEELPPDHQYKDIPIISAQEYEWMYHRAKIQWFEGLYENSTINNPLVCMFQCTTLDLFSYLYKKKKNIDTTTMVIVKLFKDGKLIDTEDFFV